MIINNILFALLLNSYKLSGACYLCDANTRQILLIIYEVQD